MKLKTRIWLSLGALMAVVLTVDLSISYQKLSKELRAESESDARTVYGFMMAVRRIYQQQFIDSEIPLNSKTIGFLPAHSFSRISRDFANWNDSGIVFNNVSDRPRNPGNQADHFELAAIDWFRANPKSPEHSEFIADASGSKYLLYTAPIWTESFCLKCHGQQADAPPSIRENYDSAYNYQIGELRGVASIRIPKAKFDQRLNEIWGGQLIKSLISYGLIFLALSLLLDRLISRRLARLRDGAERIASGDYSARISADGGDELTNLAQTFNHMAEEVQQRDQKLSTLTQAMEQSPESIVITDTAGCIEYVNEQFVRNTGYSHDEVIGLRPSLLKSGRTPEATYQSLWATLLRGETWHGELCNRRKDGSEFVEHAIISPVQRNGLTTHYLAIKQDVTAHKKAEAAIEQLAYFDTLTGLPNRALLLDRLRLVLAMAQRQHDSFSTLICFNIDRFKAINDACGAECGDHLLQALARRLGGLLRDGDTLARLAGDDFAILLQDIASEREIASRRALFVARKLHAELRSPFSIDHQPQITLTASVGIALCPESADDSASEALRRADTALHRAKSNGGNQSAFFETTMGELAESRFLLENELRRAIPGGELRLYLQPQFRADGSIAGCEALVRWQHPTRGLLAPGMFIELAEESDLIVELGAWVMGEACRLMSSQRCGNSPLHLSVNISPRHFRRSDFIPWLIDLLSVHGVSPEHLTLEVTEGLMIDNIEDIVAKMTQLSSHGILFSLDDFGTGYSSLAHIKRLPIDELKIDKSFVQDAPNNPSDAALVETILAVAKHMGLQVVAEGVETTEQAAFLQARGEVIVQGYLFGRPEPAATWLARWNSQPPADAS